MSERDWLIVAGVVVLILIVLDGIRRMRNRNKLRLEIDSKFNNLPEEDFHGELPNGGARVVAADNSAHDFDTVSGLNSSSSQSNTHSADRDVDLLMDGDLKGVGQGADRWLDPGAERSDPEHYPEQQRTNQSEEYARYSEQKTRQFEETAASTQVSRHNDGNTYRAESDELLGLSAEDRRISTQADELQSSLRQPRQESYPEEDVLSATRQRTNTIPSDDLDSLYADPEQDNVRTDTTEYDRRNLDTHGIATHDIDAFDIDAHDLGDRPLDDYTFDDRTFDDRTFDDRKSGDGIVGSVRVRIEPRFDPDNATVPDDIAAFDSESELKSLDSDQLQKSPASDAPLSLVEDDGLDLSQPVTVLMEQMKNGERHDSNGVTQPRSSRSESNAGGNNFSLSNNQSLSEEPFLSADPFSDESISKTKQAADTKEISSNAMTADRRATGGGTVNDGSAIKMDSADLDMDAIEAEFGTVAAYDPDLEPASETTKPISKKTSKKRSRKLAAKNAADAKKEPAKPAKKSRISRLRDEIQTSFFDLDPDLAPEPIIEEKPTSKEKTSTKAKKEQSDQAGKKNVSPPAPQQNVDKERNPSLENGTSQAPVLVINVAGRNPFPGKPLFRLLEACAMEFGDMNIFHRFEDGPSQGSIQFSMANAIKPGYFDLSQAEHFETPAVTFFLDMSEPRELMNAFDCMLATAQCVADNLDGQLKDENRSVMRSQTIEHYRQEIRDYERRRLAKRA